MEIVTADDTWPEIPEARVRILQPSTPGSDLENGRDDGHDR